MKKNKGYDRYCVIVEGTYLTQSEAEHALRDPFIEDWVEEKGRFRSHNLGEIEVAQGVALGSLDIVIVEDGLFEITSNNPDRPLTEHKAKCVAEALRRQDMFDEVHIEPLDSVDETE